MFKDADIVEKELENGKHRRPLHGYLFLLRCNCLRNVLLTAVKNLPKSYFQK